MAEFIAKKTFFCQYNGMIYKKKNWKHNSYIQQGVRQNSNTGKHQYIANIQRITAMVEYALGNQVFSKHLPVFSAPDDICQANSHAPYHLPKYSDEQTGYDWPPIIINAHIFCCKYFPERNKNCQVKKNENKISVLKKKITNLNHSYFLIAIKPEKLYHLKKTSQWLKPPSRSMEMFSLSL